MRGDGVFRNHGMCWAGLKPCVPCARAYNCMDQTCFPRAAAARSAILTREFLMSEDQERTGGLTGQVKDVIDMIRPALQGHGGDIELVDVDEQTGVVSVRLQGACRGCAGALMTLKLGVERHLKQQVPQVKQVVAVE